MYDDCSVDSVSIAKQSQYLSILGHVWSKEDIRSPYLVSFS